MLLLAITLALNLLFPQNNDLTGNTLDLDDYVWKNRIVLIFADDKGGDLLNRQIDHLLEDRDELLDRNLLLFSFREEDPIKEHVHSKSFLSNKGLRHKYNKPDEGFYVVLIGKDGGVKYEDSSFLQREKLYAIIDAMPMRRAEMRRKSSGN